MQYHLLAQDGRQSITVFAGGEVYVADDSHPNFAAIKDAVLDFSEGDDPAIVTDLFDTARTINKHFERLSERVLVRDGAVYVDGERTENSLTRQVLKFLQEGLDFKPLVNFFEKVLTNPNTHSRDHLYRWLKDRDFTITEDGDFIAYKSVQLDVDTAQFLSWTSGNNIVIVDEGDGPVEVEGRVPNNLGAIVEMPRDEVTFDPAVGCSIGLHAGTMSYARGFGFGPNKVLVSVKINPRDVVSVPTDSSDQKLRVGRYRVLEVVEDEYKTPLHPLDDDRADWTREPVWEDDADEDEDEDPECAECGDVVDGDGDLCEDCEMAEAHDIEDHASVGGSGWKAWWQRL